MQKTCTKCKILKSTTEFNVKKSSYDGLKPWCRSCQKIDAKRYRDLNREKLNRDSRERYYTDPNVKLSKRKWEKANPDKVYAGTKRYRARHPDKAAAWNAVRRAKVVATRTEYVNYEEIYEYYNYECYLCNEAIDLTVTWPHPKSKSMDHIIPLAKGGSHTRDNLAPAHAQCNMLKGGD